MDVGARDVAERNQLSPIHRPGSMAFLAMVALSLAMAVSPAAAAFKPISGRLSRAGLTVIAVGYNGKVTLAKGPAFRLATRDSRVTLQLRDAQGKYAGPIVVAGKGAKVYEGVDAGAKLGTIKVLRGYARVGKPLTKKQQKKWLDPSRWAHARNGVPLANGLNFGLVRIADHSGSRAGGGDIAHSGVPNNLSIDADADGIIDAIKRSGRAGASAVEPPPPPPATPPEPPSFPLWSTMFAEFQDSVNADASTISTAQIDSTMTRWGVLNISIVPGDVTNLDCGGLTYCAPGGSGHEYVYPGSGIQPLCSSQAPSCNYNEGPAFPACCDADGDGLGDLPQGGQPGHGGFFELSPEAGSAQIGSGDVLIQRVTTGGVATQVPGTLNFVFNTTPGLMRWSSGSDSATVTYPVAPGSPGTMSNPWPIGGGAGHVVVTLTFWRPQRNGIAGAGEPAFMDIGHLAYSSQPYVLSGGSNAGPPTCPPSSYSTNDPNLTPQSIATPPPSPPDGLLVDGADDAPADAGNTITYSIDVTDCFNANGATLRSGDLLNLDILAQTTASASGSGNNSSKSSQSFDFTVR